MTTWYCISNQTRSGHDQLAPHQSPSVSNAKLSVLDCGQNRIIKVVGSLAGNSNNSHPHNLKSLLQYSWSWVQSPVTKPCPSIVRPSWLPLSCPSSCLGPGSQTRARSLVLHFVVPALRWILPYLVSGPDLELPKVVSSSIASS